MAIPVSSDQTGGVPSQQRLRDLFAGFEQRLSILERTSSLNSASIGRGGIRLYDGGVFRWYNYNYDIHKTPDQNLDSLVFEIGSFKPDDLEDFGVAFRYYHPSAQANPDPVVIIGSFPEIGNPTQDSHGIYVESHEDAKAPLFAVSSDMLFLAKSKPNDFAGYQIILLAEKDEHDEFTLWMDNEQHYFSVRTGATDQRAYVRGGNSGAGFGVAMRMHGTAGGDSRRVEFLNSDNLAEFVDVYVRDLVYSGALVPSSVDIKDVHGVFDRDAVADVMSTPIKRWNYSTQVEQARMVEEPELDRERIGPVAEEVPDHLLVDTPNGVAVDTLAAQWTLWAAVQQQQEQIEALTARVAVLEAELGK